MVMMNAEDLLFSNFFCFVFHINGTHKMFADIAKIEKRTCNLTMANMRPNSAIATTSAPELMKKTVCQVAV